MTPHDKYYSAPATTVKKINHPVSHWVIKTTNEALSVSEHAKVLRAATEHTFEMCAREFRIFKT